MFQDSFKEQQGTKQVPLKTIFGPWRGNSAGHNLRDGDWVGK